MGKAVSHTSISRKRWALGIAAVYFTCVILGCLVIWLIPFWKNRTSLLEIAEDKGNEVLSAGLMEEVMIFGMDYALFSENGFQMYKINNFLYESQWDLLPEYAGQVFEQGQIFKPAILLLDNRDEDPRYIFGVILGVQVESRSGHRFASILIRDFSDLDTSMCIYVVIFTFLYAIGLAFMARTLKKERELNRMRQDLIANVSHELKTPITAIRAIAEVLHDGMIRDEKTRREYGGKLMEESDRLEQLVLDILELNRLQSKGVEFHKRVCYADGILPPVVDRYMMLCGDLGITLDISQLHLESIPALYTDTEKIPLLLNILLDNAVKFNSGTIWISSQTSTKFTTFCIRDNGPGIHGDEIDRVFDRFYKADTAHNSSGSGLGLAIADELAKGLNERLWAESVYGEGSSFFFTIHHINTTPDNKRCAESR